MKNKILVISLVVLSALLIFEVGYLAGISEQRLLYRTLFKQCRSFRQAHNIFFDRSMPRQMAGTDLAADRTFRQRASSFFAATMTSKETAEQEIITISLPGLKKENIKIEVKARELTVRISTDNFIQRVALPENANVQQISAQFDKDMLTLKIPKAKQPRKIAEGVINIPVK